jgi:hypothetical protein
MKKILLMLTLILCGTNLLKAQAHTGDADFDVALNDINTNAKANLTEFKKDLGVKFNIGIASIDHLMSHYKMQPADIFMALQIGQQTGKAPEQVAQSFQKNNGKGWGVIAKEMGIKPGSPEFHSLKDQAKGHNNKMKEKNNGHGNNGDGGHGNGNHGNKGKGKK